VSGSWGDAQRDADEAAGDGGAGLEGEAEEFAEDDAEGDGGLLGQREGVGADGDAQGCGVGAAGFEEGVGEFGSVAGEVDRIRFAGDEAVDESDAGEAVAAGVDGVADGTAGGLVGLEGEEAGKQLDVVAGAVESDGGVVIRPVFRGRRGKQSEEAAGAGAVVGGGDEFDGDGEGGTVPVAGGGRGEPAALGVEVAADFRAEAAGVIGLEEAVEALTGEFAGGESEEFFRGWVEAGDAAAVVEQDGWDGEIMEPRAGAGGSGGAGGDGGDVADDEAELL
jgi:hypothetical protein